MWVITSNAFVSIVQHRDEPRLMIVRGRFKGDVQRFLGPQAEELVTPHADYRFRAFATRIEVAAAMGRAVAGITYPNFKDSIVAKWRKALAMRVWSMFHAAQNERSGLARAVKTGPMPLHPIGDGIW